MKRILPFVFFMGCHGATIAQKTEVTFGMVLDGPSPQFEREWLPLMKREITALLERDFQVAFPEEKALRSQWSVNAVKSHLDRLLDDPEVDLVLCIGVLSTLEAAGRGPFPKPVIAPFGINAEIPIYPRKEGTSGVHNFNYTVTPTSLTRDIALMRKMKPVSHLYLVADELIAGLVPGLQTFVTEELRKQGLTVSFLLARERADQVLDNLPQNAEMVYLTPLLRFTAEERQRLYHGLMDRKAPSFSMSGRDEVELGALAGLAPKSDTLRWVRRIALNVQRTLLGEDPANLPTLMSEKSKLSINMATARAIDWYPPWELQIAADLLNEQPVEEMRMLSLGETVLKAMEVNLDIQAAAREVEAGRTNIDLAKARRRPQLDATFQGVQIDEDRAAASLGIQPERSVDAALTLQQLVFSDSANATVAIQRKLQIVRERNLEILRLDLARETAIRFLNYLKAQTLVRIQKENLDLTAANLETARVRRDIGISGPADVYRWESQYASDQRQAINASAQADVALAVLNQVLHFPQEALIDAEPPSLMDPSLMTGRGRLNKYVGNEKDFEIFRGFMVAEGLRNAPELAQIDALVAAKELEVAAAKRGYYLPTVSFRAQLSHNLDRNGGEGLMLPIPEVTFPQPEDSGWSAALNVSLPLSNGGARKQGLAQDRIELDQLKLQRQAAAEKIELRIRISLQQVGAASVAIDLSRASAEAARNNFELVKDGYAKGVATVTNLLDAQNAALIADQAAANAEYDFLIELMGFQRAAANFDFFSTDAAREAFFQRLEEMFQRFE